MRQQESTACHRVCLTAVPCNKIAQHTLSLHTPLHLGSTQQSVVVDKQTTKKAGLTSDDLFESTNGHNVTSKGSLDVLPVLCGVDTQHDAAHGTARAQHGKSARASWPRFFAPHLLRLAGPPQHQYRTERRLVQPNTSASNPANPTRPTNPPVVGVHEHEASNALLLALVGVEGVGAGLKLATVCMYGGGMTQHSTTQHEDTSASSQC